jgi:hypothetical protein
VPVGYVSLALEKCPHECGQRPSEALRHECLKAKVLPKNGSRRKKSQCLDAGRLFARRQTAAQRVMRGKQDARIE